ncbi:MAG TPA: peptidylprolyl isomerase [Gaiellaceae bacterium]|nr:peptidylprolyl isomerase [Gaiellaceae bacterium]
MTLARITLGTLLAALALAASACGGDDSGSVPSGSIAVVDGTEIAKEDLDELIAQAKKGYESQKQEFPKAGSPEYQSIQTQYVAYLVELEQFRQAADELGVSVTDKDVDEAEQELIKSRFDGKRAAYEKALEAQGFTAEQYREKALEVSALSKRIFDDVTKGVKVTEPEILAYYTQNQSQYGTPESRDVRHILIADKGSDGKVDFAASKAKADDVYAQLEGGADFAALAKSNSADPGSKDSGGKLTISRGQTVPEFDKVSFELDKGELSQPVKTEYGYHVIEAVSDIREASTTPIEKVRATIRATLLQQKRNDEMQAWVEELKAGYEGKVSYAAGYEPPELPEAPTETTQ